MAEEVYGTEVSKKRKTPQNVLDYIPDWIPGVSTAKETRKRIEGTSKKKTKKESPWGEYE